METLLIITNNPAVEAHYLGCAMRLCADYQQVLLTARDAIHLGRCLLMHPEVAVLRPRKRLIDRYYSAVVSVNWTWFLLR